MTPVMEAQSRRRLWREEEDIVWRCTQHVIERGGMKMRIRILAYVIILVLLCGQDAIGEVSTKSAKHRRSLGGARTIYGFEEKGRLTAKEIGAFNTTIIHYRHVKTQADFVSVITSDAQKAFFIEFRTPPSGNEGTPHILEHGVLGGSRRYPINDAFTEAVYGNTGNMNAFTATDTTAYFVQSTNTQEFWNLFDLYWDAVYHPRCVIDDSILKSEGWSYRLEHPDDELTIKGLGFERQELWLGSYREVLEARWIYSS
ncbi:hypothetical protein CBR_g30954 [Chara braunii]|uniref:Peptidase M16 N-terminal domain-containing protein n=1 Tax=Chara braunii TaxID=69332 RepID=A0A388LE51_CHABU|nr:hypothetical protein CBR_g30954 [Chara braunii]|eukprot:GBG80492.1 hypothetical protein CBR_g30954 [Chara braunii]